MEVRMFNLILRFYDKYSRHFLIFQFVHKSEY